MVSVLVTLSRGQVGGGGGADEVEGKGYVLGSTSGIVFVCWDSGLGGDDWVGCCTLARQMASLSLSACVRAAPIGAGL